MSVAYSQIYTLKLVWNAGMMQYDYDCMCSQQSLVTQVIFMFWNKWLSFFLFKAMDFPKNLPSACVFFSMFKMCVGGNFWAMDV